MLIEIKCNFCKKLFFKAINRFNEAEKFGWKHYCSSYCQYNSKLKIKIFKCGNPHCDNLIKRAPGAISKTGICFCSNKCAAIINNKKRIRHLPKKYCANPKCYKEICRRNKFCSRQCQAIFKKIPLEKHKIMIINRIQEFYKKNKRIPMKREMWGIYKPARKLYGSWNKAIESAGYKPNPVLFANKQIAIDGHKCDSMAEKIIDDWLYDRKIPHKIKVPYFKNRMTADFKVNDIFIEFFGLKGQIKKYDRLVREKEKLFKERNLKVIKIYPEDLFPVNKLEKILIF